MWSCIQNAHNFFLHRSTWTPLLTRIWTFSARSTVMLKDAALTGTMPSQEKIHVLHNGILTSKTVALVWSHCASELPSSMPAIQLLQHTMRGVQYKYFQYANSLHWDWPNNTPSLFDWNSILFWTTVKLLHSSKTMHLWKPRRYSLRHGAWTFWQGTRSVAAAPYIDFAYWVLP